MRKEWKDVSGFGNGKENSITGRLFRGTVTIRSNTTITENIKHPRELLRKILAENKSPRIKGQPSFTGGLVGYFSYDYIRYAEPVLDFGDEGAEDFKDLDLMLFDKIIAFDHLTQDIILIAGARVEDLETSYHKAEFELKQMADLVMNGKEAEFVPVPEFIAETNA